MKTKKHWYDYLWIWAIVYFSLGFFNILFAWLGMIDFLLPVGIALFGGNKWFCNNLCGRGQLLSMLGGRLGCSFKRPTPKWLTSKWFRYGFLIFFSGDVCEYGFSDLFGCGRGRFPERSYQAVLDGKSAVGLDLLRRSCTRLGSAVQFRLLQSDADFPSPRTAFYGTF